MKLSIGSSMGRRISVYALQLSVLLAAAFAASGCADVVATDAGAAEEGAAANEPLWKTGINGLLVKGEGLGGGLCRGAYAGGYHPGRELSNSGCHITFGGKAIMVDRIFSQFLALTWEEGAVGSVPVNARAFPERDHVAYLCTAPHGTSLQVGSVSHRAPGCSYSYGGAEYVAPVYNVLMDDVPVRFVPHVPPNSFPPEVLYVGWEAGGPHLHNCAVEIDGAMRYGKTREDWDSCAVGYNGREVFAVNYWLLVPSWVEPNGTFWRAGHEAGGEPLGFCRTKFSGTNYLGKALTNGHCNIPVDGLEVSVTDPTMFDVLRNVP